MSTTRRVAVNRETQSVPLKSGCAKLTVTLIATAAAICKLLSMNFSTLRRASILSAKEPHLAVFDNHLAQLCRTD
ncbi:hypothetical protein KCP75_10005 [Salmonella enterica subsp. enterica]|nr:hypothetical protein KCP75_10005 [Salmonella enterica subsp. enterica]